MKVLQRIRSVSRRLPSGLVGGACVALLLTCALPAEQAIAKEFKLSEQGIFGWLAVGNITMIDKGHAYWVGQFSGVYTEPDTSNPLNDSAWQCPGFNDVGTAAGGYCVISDAAGDALYAKWQNDGGVPVSKGTYVYTGGTGKFAGATGGGDFSGHFAGGPHPDGTQSGYTVFSNAKLVLVDK